MPTPNTQTAQVGQTIPYLDLGGGLNTRKDPHALARNELALSINLSPAFDNAIAKRPGSVRVGTTGSGLACNTLLVVRFNDFSYLIEVKDNGNVWAGRAIPGSTFTMIGTLNPTADFVTCAQMFDPTLQMQVAFFCDGKSPPHYWTGPGDSLHIVFQGTNSFGAGLPAKDKAGDPITPQYVLAFGQHLFYAGEPSQPSAVYVSDPFYPQYFNSPAMQVASNQAVTPSQYVPIIVGNNDGVLGGIITGLAGLGQALIVFKECAIYTLIATTLLGEVPAWQVVLVSNNRGCLSPRSLVFFDTFLVFLSLDGIYATDGTTIWLISGDVPTYFDSTLNGTPALITDRTDAIGVRDGTRYVIFFISSLQPVKIGVWFDFSKQSASGFPIAGEWDGIAPGGVGGAAALTGRHDDGNFVWSDEQSDLLGLFGVGFDDIDTTNNPVKITSTFAGKADLFEDAFGPEYITGDKAPQYAKLLVEIQQAAQGQQKEITFTGTFIVNSSTSLVQSIPQPIEQQQGGGGGGGGGGIWGTSKWGQFKWGSGGGGGQSGVGFAIAKMPAQIGTRGPLIQLAVTESSNVPWIIIGYVIYANAQLDAY